MENIKEYAVPASVKSELVALKIWHENMSKLSRNMTPSQLSSLERFCNYGAIFDSAQRDVSVNGLTLKAVNGISYKNPMFDIMNRASVQMQKCAKEFANSVKA